MVKVAIVEDEMHYIEQIKEYLKRYQKDENQLIDLSVYRDGEDILEEYKGDYDIILMDIQMRFMDGMTTAEHIRKLDQKVIIIFITNMIQYAVRGYAVDALDYVLKPVSYFSFQQKLNKAISKINKRHNHFITIPLTDGVQKINIEHLYYIESQGHYLNYHTNGESYLARGTMQELEEMFSLYGFFRINKGTLVNMVHVTCVRNGFCIMGDKQLVVSRQRKKKFLEMLTNYISEVVG